MKFIHGRILHCETSANCNPCFLTMESSTERIGYSRSSYIRTTRGSTISGAVSRSLLLKSIYIYFLRVAFSTGCKRRAQTFFASDQIYHFQRRGLWLSKRHHGDYNYGHDECSDEGNANLSSSSRFPDACNIPADLTKSGRLGFGKSRSFTEHRKQRARSVN